MNSSAVRSSQHAASRDLRRSRQDPNWEQYVSETCPGLSRVSGKPGIGACLRHSQSKSAGLHQTPTGIRTWFGPARVCQSKSAGLDQTPTGIRTWFGPARVSGWGRAKDNRNSNQLNGS
ncbi:hypothetical protein SUGI_0522010 [Cryptomeria japonica]|nr:hypothetical protein SUGI_0522010 [Cryptomeria japonica]